MDGKVALITGSGRGIGLGMAQAFAAVGAAVAIQDIDLDVASAEAAKITAAGGRAIALGGDINDLTLPRRAVAETVEKLGGLHVLVNNASIQSKKYWLEAEPEAIEREFRANITSPILFCQEAVKIFKSQKWGRIINLGSIQQRFGNSMMLPYALSKCALELLTKTLARDLAAQNITVNLIAPGWMDTYRNRLDWKDEEEKAETGRKLPMGRLGTPKDCMGLAVLMCSEAGEYMTGQHIFVDGGMTAYR